MTSFSITPTAQRALLHGLRNAQHGQEIFKLLGAHDALGAVIAERSGFDGVWASGFEMSASAGYPDASLMTMTEVVQRSAELASNVEVPVLVDCDTGFGNVNNVRRLVQLCERAGIAGICLEDKHYPKLNSFVEGSQDQVTPAEFAAKIVAATDEKHELVVVARIESLISGATMEDALHRARVYEAAGADALLIHSKLKVPREIDEFCRRYDGSLPVLVVPTTYPQASAPELKGLGASGVIYANQGLRGAVRAMTAVAESILATGSTQAIEQEIVSMGHLYDLQGMPDLLRGQQVSERAGEQIAFDVTTGGLDADAVGQ